MIRQGYLSVTAICLILGILLVWRLKLEEKFELAATPGAQNILAVEVNQLIKDNQQLREEFLNLQKQHQTLVETGTTSGETAQSLSKNLTQYKIIAGLTPVEGEGVVISFEKPLLLAQLIDLVNALRNIGMEALSINGQRIAPDTPIPNNVVDRPYIEVIGDKDLLQNALTRRGGILDQVGGGGSVQVKDRLVLSAKQ